MSSSVPVVIPAFQALAATALPAGSQVIWSTVLPANIAGPGELTGVASGAYLQITGVRFEEDAPAELGPLFRHEEHYNILCCLTVWAGDDDYNERLADAGTVYNDLAIAISNAPQLDLATATVPRLAWPRQLSWTPTPDPFGRPSVIVEFEVEVQARVTSLT